MRSLKNHGMSETPTYHIWEAMHQRCRDPKMQNYEYYGGRGISVTKRWHSFENFLVDMGERPFGLTLERRNNDRNYCKSNCRWATLSEQANNRSTNRRLTYKGTTKTAIQWSRHLGAYPSCVSSRLSKGWTVERAVTTPSTARNWSNS